MRPAPLTSEGLTLEEITCRGWGPHLQYSFLIKLASLSGKYKKFHNPQRRGITTKEVNLNVQNFMAFVTVDGAELLHMRKTQNGTLTEFL